MDTYISLHNHTDYSNLRMTDSIIKVPGLIDYALELGLKGVAITDHEAICGHIKAQSYLKKLKAAAKGTEKEEQLNNFRLLLGNEIYLCRNGLNKSNYEKEKDRYFHFILIAKDAIGHKQIRELSSRAWLRSYSQFILRVPTYYSDIEEVVGNEKGHLIATSACLGSYLGVNSIRYYETKDETILIRMKNYIKWCQKYFGDDFYLEVQPGVSKEQIAYNKLLKEFSKEFGIKLSVATDSHYLKKEDRPLHKAFLNAAEGDRETGEFYNSTYMMSPKELKEILTAQGFDVDKLFETTLEIGEKCEDIEFAQPIEVPAIDIPPFTNPYPLPDKDKYPYTYALATSTDPQDLYLSYLIEKGLREKVDPSLWEEHRQRDELEITELVELSKRINSSMSAYHITVAKICDIIWDKADSIMGISRGSGFGFNINYLIGITQASPLGHGIEFVHWRYINRDRVSMADLDLDTQATKKPAILKAIKDYFGEHNAVQLATFATEKPKAAILTAARGLGIDNDLAQYYASMVPVERGFPRSLNSCFYGDDDHPPVAQFVQEMKANPRLWEVAQKIEGLISRRGVHACGIIISRENLVNRNALMVSPTGAVTTQYDLEDSEYQGGLKFDLLSTDALDRIRTTIDLLIENGEVEKKDTLRETYESVVGVKNLIFENKEMWKMLHEGKIGSCFQMDTPVGKQGVQLAKPENPLELTSVNSIMRLMPPQGQELPLLTYVRFKNDINEWYREMYAAGLTEEEVKIMRKHLDKFYGIAATQESAMALVMDKEIAGFSIKEADKLRKVIAKKKMKEIETMREFFFNKGHECGTREDFLNYIWDIQISRQLGYSFNLHHSYTYALIALQEINLAYRFPLIYWNTACLIVDSGSTDEDEDDAPLVIKEEDLEEDTEEEDEDEPKDKKKNKTVRYGKISAAIGKIQSQGTKVSLPDINKSGYTFKPDCENDVILYGLKGITRVGDDIVLEIMKNRPFSSFQDFLSRVKTNKLQTINLIKSGCFDKLGNRFDLMKEYLTRESKPKKRITLQNMAGLIEKQLLPDEFDFHRRLFNYNKYLKTLKVGENFILDTRAYTFYSAFFNEDILSYNGKNFILRKTDWDKMYKKKMEEVKPYLKDHQEELLDKMNNSEVQALWDKYCPEPSLSKWEMDSVGFYYHEHELSKVSWLNYGIKDFNNMPEDPVIEKLIDIKGKQIPILKLSRIIGTVVDKDKLKSTVTLSTPTGVVTVKVYKAQFTKYDKQISVRLPSGKKKVVEKSWFTRGNKLLITGVRRQDNFVPKTYKSNAFGKYPFGLITKIDGHEIEFTNERAGDEE